MGETCLSQAQCCLSFCNFEAISMVVVAKQTWNIVHNPNSLVVKLITSRYFSRFSLFEAPLGYNPSFVWRSIWHTRQVLLLGCRRQIGSGDNIYVLCLTRGCVGMILDGCSRLNLHMYISYLLKISCTKVIKCEI
jgi:hypothetical protein